MVDLFVDGYYEKKLTVVSSYFQFFIYFRKYKNFVFINFNIYLKKYRN